MNPLRELARLTLANALQVRLKTTGFVQSDNMKAVEMLLACGGQFHVVQTTIMGIWLVDVVGSLKPVFFFN